MILRRTAVLSLALAVAFPVLAQQRPDAGQTLQERKAPPAAPAPSPELDLEPKKATTLKGGKKITVKSVSFSGNTAFNDAALISVLGDVTGKSYDLAGLRALAERVSAYYRANGYPFARALLPAQDARSGALKIEVVEGRYGAINLKGKDPNTAKAKPWLDGLKTGSVITAESLERPLLLLGDLPGYDVEPVMSPSKTAGAGDLDVTLIRNDDVSGRVGFSNFGNRFTGYMLFNGGATWYSPFMLGDQIDASVTVSEESLVLGSLLYALPIFSDGLRANLGYSRTNYELGRDFANLNASGSADIISAGLSYPVWRSRVTNLSFAGTYQYKGLRDEVRSVGTVDNKHSHSGTISTNFDRTFATAGAVVYGSLGFTAGSLSLDAAAADPLRTRGSFGHLNVELAHLQSLAALADPLSMFIRFNAQFATKNLDSSEGRSTGGVYGVRAYPTGESSGDEGFLTQMEIRYQLPYVQPYLFYDQGVIHTDADPAVGVNNTRALAGGGLGARAQITGVGMEIIAAIPTKGGRPQADTSGNPKPRLWAGVTYNF